MLSITNLSFAVLRPRNSTSIEDDIKTRKYRNYIAFAITIEECLNMPNINNIEHNDYNLLLNDDYLIEFARILASEKSFHFEKMDVQTNGSDTIRIISPSLMKEVCKYHFNRLPSKTISESYVYNSRPCIYKDDEKAVYNKNNNVSVDVDKDTITVTGFELNVPSNIINNHPRLNVLGMGIDPLIKNNVSCDYCYNAKVIIKDGYISELYYSKHKITDEEREKFKKSYFK